MLRNLWLALGVHLSLWFAGCDAREEPAASPEPVEASAAAEVVVYTALDALYSEPILDEFERQTGIEVLPVYDAEAAKTTGLVSRIVEERERPRCDVFWNNEIARTIWLKEQGLLEPYASPQAEAIPATFKDPEHAWTGFGARARVLVFNTQLIERNEIPTDLTQLTDERWHGKLGMAYPLFGTTSTHAAVLYALWGEQQATAFFQALQDNGVRVLQGNMSVCRAVADGELPLGLTDTDDAHLLQSEGRPIDWVPINHEGKGALLIPNTVALIANAPHREAAKKLIDYLLSPEVERRLAASPSAQIPLHPDVEAPALVRAMREQPWLEADFAAAAARLEASGEILRGLFSEL